jgi:hypothetical protein
MCFALCVFYWLPQGPLGRSSNHASGVMLLKRFSLRSLGVVGSAPRMDCLKASAAPPTSRPLGPILKLAEGERSLRLTPRAFCPKIDPSPLASILHSKIIDMILFF